MATNRRARTLPAGEDVLRLARERGSISIAELRDELATGRKYAQALEHLDGEHVLIRRGDRHVPREPRRAIPR